MDAIVVYRSNPESLQKVLGLLRKEGFNPTTLEDPGTEANLYGAGRASYLISIAVPGDEAAGAESVLRKWDKTRRSDVDKMTGELAGPFIFSVMAVGVLAVVLFALGILWDAVAMLFVAWIAFFALAANAEKMKLKMKGPKRR